MKSTSIAPGMVASFGHSTVRATTGDWRSVQAPLCDDLAAFAEVFGASGEADGEAICLAVTACVLARYAGRAEIRFTLAAAGAGTAPGAWPLTLCLATDRDFADLLGQARSALAAVATAEAPGAGGESLPADARFQYVVAGSAGPTDGGAAEPLFRFVATDRQIALELRFDADAFAAGAMADLAACVRQAFANQAASPSTAVGRIDIVAPETRRRLLVDWNGRTVPYPKDRTILRLFEDQAAATPDRPAITFADATLSYRSLNGRANELAVRLREAGIGKGDLVPLVMNSCLELPVAMIALMKLGAAFVPVDLTWSAERIRMIVGEVRPKLVIRSAPAPVFDELGVPAFAVVQAALPERDDNDHGVRVGMEDLIYGFFTSGSTGTPKCALNIHLGLLNRFLYMSRRYRSDGRDVVLQNSKHVFDSSIWQLLWPLTNGSRVVIPPPIRLLDLSQTIEIIAAHGITMTDFVPSIFNAMVNLLTADQELAEKLRSLRQLLIGGEEISPKAVQKFRAMLPHVGITNTFGPTEASIGSVFHEVTEADGQSIPIGRSIDNTYVAILDENMNLLPPGAIGEIYIGGDCLGKGYLNDSAKTAAAFVGNCCREIPGEQLYRTGDLAYHRPDGMIQFVGRKDYQVKIGGVRIELTEIESVLVGHPKVREAKVVVHGDAEQKMLLAFVVAEGSLDAAVLCRHVEQALPKHSVPKQFFFLQAMPLTHNGKIDRKALARMVSEAGSSRPPSADEAASAEERAVRSVWLQVLKLGVVGISDDFFACGGDSLLALNLSLALEERLGVKVSVQDVFRHPTVREQAALIASGTGKPDLLRVGREAAALVAEVVLDSSIIAASPSQQRLPENVFLTGSTGFVGAQLLHDLLTASNAKAFCLVRDADEVVAHQRLRDNLKHYDLWQDGFAARIVPVAGDLSRPGLGLAPGQFDRLASTIDTIVHNGAMVNFLHDYHHHRSTNVAGTVEILKLAAASESKRVHYVSTLSVFPTGGTALADKIPEEAEPFDAAVADGGYNQSKWVAEKILWRARERGVPVTIYRLGEVMPHSRTGIPNFKALSDTLLRGCLKLGLHFRSPIRLDYTPVDRVSRFIVASVNDPEVSDGCFHVFHPKGILFDDLLESFRRPEFGLRDVSYGEFWATLRKLCVRNPADKDLMLLLTLLPEPAAPAGAEDQECAAKLTGLFTDNTLHFSCARTQAMLHRWALDWPSLDRRVFDAYAAYHRAALAGTAAQQVGDHERQPA